MKAIELAPYLIGWRGINNVRFCARNRRFGVFIQMAVFAFSLVSGLSHGLCPVAAQNEKIGKDSGLKVPRYVSLRASRVNLRKGPGTDYPTAWVFRHIGLPVEVIEEFEAWRQVRDADNTTGWVLKTLLSGRRTGQVLPWEIKEGKTRPQADLFSRRSESAGVVARVEAGVVANILSCDGAWCYIEVKNIEAYIPQKKLWGVYPNERIE